MYSGLNWTVSYVAVCEVELGAVRVMVMWDHFDKSCSNRFHPRLASRRLRWPSVHDTCVRTYLKRSLTWTWPESGASHPLHYCAIATTRRSACEAANWSWCLQLRSESFCWWMMVKRKILKYQDARHLWFWKFYIKTRIVINRI